VKLRRRTTLSIVIAGALGVAAAARDDFLRGSNRDLSKSERVALETLVGELGNPDPVVRNRTVRHVAALGRAAIPALEELLKKANDPKLLRNVCLALGTIDDPASFALLEKIVVPHEASEDVLRAALFATGRGRGYPAPELADALRRLSVEASLATVREAALLAAGARKVAGLGDLWKGAAGNEKLARVRGCMLLALAESGDAAAVEALARALDPKRNRDEMVRRAALAATALCGEGPLLDAVLKSQPDAHELSAWCLALGAFKSDAAVDALGRALTHDGEKAADAVFSLASLGTPAARDLLRRAIAGEFSPAVAEAACVAVAPLVDEQRYLAGLRAAAESEAEGLRAAALLTLARIKDHEAAAAIVKQLPTWRDPRLLTRGLLLCATTLDTPLEELLPKSKAGPVADLWRTIDQIEKRRANPRLLDERLALEFTRARGHWLLRRDDLRGATIRELLELDKVVFVTLKGSGTIGGGAPPPDSGGGGSGGGGSDGSGSGGSGSGGSGSGGGGSGDGSGGSGSGGDGGGLNGAPGQRRGKPDTARFELDLRQWLEDFPLFAASEPFGR
jgi:HEAT repeat protein